MVGRTVGGAHASCSTAPWFTSGKAYRQGFSLDVGRARRMAPRAGARRDGAGARTRPSAFGPAAARGSVRIAGDRVYQHRFAEPFDALSARLALAPLPGLGGAGYVYALAGLSLAVAVLGLAALYRMVTVVVRYAERRSNFVAAVTARAEDAAHGDPHVRRDAARRHGPVGGQARRVLSAHHRRVGAA